MEFFFVNADMRPLHGGTDHLKLSTKQMFPVLKRGNKLAKWYILLRFDNRADK